MMPVWRWLRAFPLWLGPWWFALLALCLGSTCGRWVGRRSAKPAPCPAAVTRNVAVASKLWRDDAASTTEATQENERVTHRRFYPPTPGAPCKEPALAAETIRERATDTRKTGTTTSTVAAEETARVELKTVPVPAPRWGFTAGYGLTQDRERAWLVGGTVRVVGPFEAGATVTRANGVTAGFLTGGFRW